MSIAPGIRDRIALLRLVMIFGVIVLHTPAYVPMNAVGTGWFDLVKAFFQLAVFRASVPVLTVISGFLLFSSRIDLEPARCFAKKSRTILIPFLCFNLTLLPFALGAEMFAGMELSANLWPFDPMRWLNAAFGLTASPINYPLNFLRDLLVLMMLAPLFGWLLRHYAWPGFVLVLVVFMGNFEWEPAAARSDGGIVLHRWIGCRTELEPQSSRSLCRHLPYRLPAGLCRHRALPNHKHYALAPGSATSHLACNRLDRRYIVWIMVSTHEQVQLLPVFGACTGAAHDLGPVRPLWQRHAVSGVLGISTNLCGCRADRGIQTGHGDDAACVSGHDRR